MKLSRLLRPFLLLPLLMARVSLADCAADSEVATRFMNGYVSYSEAVYAKRTRQSIEQWLRANPLAAPTLRRAFRTQKRADLRRDPQLGSGSDALLDAQDYPEKGFMLDHCLGEAGYVMLKGVGWEDFKLTLRVDNQRITGAGVLNIPAPLRARRD